MHALPFGAVFTQLPATQERPAVQSALPVQSVKQAVPALLHTKLPGQSLVLTAGHAPAPLHEAAAVSFEPRQLCGRHAVLLPGKVQLSREPERHAPAQEPVPAQAPRPPCGWPLATGEQVPSVAGRSQASHLPSQASLQHTPSTHAPLVQSPSPEQAVPFGLAPHEPETHGLGSAHGTDAEHVVWQAAAAALHVNGAQPMAAGATHLPSPSHLAAPVVLLVALLQPAAWHTTSFHNRHLPSPSQLPSRPQLASDSGVQAG